MNITPEQIINASQTVLAILSRPDVPIPASAIDDVQVLKAVLAGIASGQIVLGKAAGDDSDAAPVKAGTIRHDANH